MKSIHILVRFPDLSQSGRVNLCKPDIKTAWEIISPREGHFARFLTGVPQQGWRSGLSFSLGPSVGRRPVGPRVGPRAGPTTNQRIAKLLIVPEVSPADAEVMMHRVGDTDGEAEAEESLGKTEDVKVVVAAEGPPGVLIFAASRR